MRASEQGSLLLRFLFLAPSGHSDLLAMRKGEEGTRGEDRGQRQWEPTGVSETQALSSVGRWGDGARVTGCGHPGLSPHF